jgi:hypothetical protein
MIFVCCNLLIQQKLQASKSIQFFLLQFSLTKKLGLEIYPIFFVAIFFKANFGLEIYLAFLLIILVMINIVD